MQKTLNPSAHQSIISSEPFLVADKRGLLIQILEVSYRRFADGTVETIEGSRPIDFFCTPRGSQLKYCNMRLHPHWSPGAHEYKFLRPPLPAHMVSRTTDMFSLAVIVAYYEGFCGGIL
jgi:hypothetical protein